MKEGFRGSRAIVLPQSVVTEMENDVLSSSLHITDIGYYPSADMHKRVRKEGIPQYILIYCVKGSGWFELDGQNHTVNSNQYFILPADKPHSYGTSSSNPWTIYWIHFKGTMAHYFAQKQDIPISINTSDSSRIYDRITIFEEIFNALENGYNKENLNFSTAALFHFLGSIKYLATFRESKRNKNSNQGDTITKAIDYMRENIEKNVTLDNIATYVGYSKSYFTNLFKEKTGYSPINYIIQLKMQRACQLLDFSGMQINQVCYKVGISDPYYFSKLFTKTIGITPSQYKAQKKG